MLYNKHMLFVAKSNNLAETVPIYPLHLLLLLHSLTPKIDRRERGGEEMSIGKLIGACQVEE